jgi:Ca2+-binding RTX toxin-like protein
MASIPTNDDDRILLNAGSPHGAIDALGGRDELRVLAAPGAAITDGFFAGLSGFEALSFQGTRAALFPMIAVSFGEQAAEAFGLVQEDGSVSGALTVQAATNVGLDFRLAPGLEAGSGELNLELRGGVMADRLQGGAGADVLDGGKGGADILSGGAGDDLFLIHSVQQVAASIIDGGAGTDTLRLLAGGRYELPDIPGIERISTGEGAYVIYPASGGGALTVQAGARTTSLIVSASSAGASLTVDGSSGDDNILGGNAADVLNGKSGNDNLYGSGGNDIFVVRADDFDDQDGISGGDGYDAIRVLGGGEISDTDFSRVNTTETITLGETEFASLEFGGIAQWAFEGNLRVSATGVKSETAIIIIDVLAQFRGEPVEFDSFDYKGSAGYDAVTLVGQSANVTGGGGADGFVVREGLFGTARIGDFEAAQDEIYIIGAPESVQENLAEAGVAGWDALTNTADGVMLTVFGESVVLEGVEREDLSASNFVFSDTPLF